MIRDKGKDEPFVGFCQPESNWWKMPNVMIDVLAYLDSASEIKVIIYLLRHTWGYSEYDVFKHITIDEFQYGRWCYNPQSGQYERMDSGTGLCRQAVKDGLAAAIAHGFIEVEIDDTDKARIRKSYRLKMRTNVQGYNVAPGGYHVAPRGLQNSPRTSNRKTLSKDTSEKDREDSKGLSPFVSLSGEAESEEESIPSWLVRFVEDFSAEFHDTEHLASNLTHCTRLYQESGLAQQAFVTLLYQARTQTQQATRIRKRNPDGSLNKMPYWFTCLKRLLKDRPTDGLTGGR